MDEKGRVTESLNKQFSRRQAIKIEEVAAVGLVFTAPMIKIIYPKPAFANYEIATSPQIDAAPSRNTIR